MPPAFGTWRRLKTLWWEVDDFEVMISASQSKPPFKPGKPGTLLSADVVN
jgi:hypothetical protein